MFVTLFGYHVNGYSEYGDVDFGYVPTLSEEDVEYMTWAESH